MVFERPYYTPFGVQFQVKIQLGCVNLVYPRIRDLREDSDLSQAELAALLGMHKTTYARYEKGEREIPLNIAISIARFHKVSLDYLAGLSKVKTIR